ncbi:MAG: RnfABCDGE type electron transport complex subunit D [Candidatus Omnitrophica bacterium]|nr:RnfABCDGE type electron transport complex subunit D [Candidatus Omnitrophota bacterium]
MKKLTINVSPHIVSAMDTRYMMKGVVKALIPVLMASLWFFRWQAFGVILAAVAGSVLTEYSLQKIRNRRICTGDYSALVTGLLLAMVLPPSIPLWMAFLGGVFAIGMGKEIFGGLGFNIFNPALLARAFLMSAFPIALTSWIRPVTLDAVTTATPLGLAKFNHVLTPYASLFFGNVAGSLGEGSALAILPGLVYLLYRKIIDYRIPAAYAVTVAVFSGAAYLIAPEKFMPPLFHVLAGGFLLGAVFMATDPVTSPVTKKGRWIFGIGCGLITMTIRLWGGLPEGVMYSILLMEACTPLINRIARPVRYGTGKER